MVEITEEVGRSFIDALISEDADKLADLFSDDAVLTLGGPAEGRTIKGKKNIRDLFDYIFRNLFADVKIKITRIVTTKDVAIVEISDDAVSRVTGQKYENEILFLIDVKDGKIQAMREYLDTVASTRALGRLPYNLPTSAS